jgi:hypothetical protein
LFFGLLAAQADYQRPSVSKALFAGNLIGGSYTGLRRWCAREQEVFVVPCLEDAVVNQGCQATARYSAVKMEEDFGS